MADQQHRSSWSTAEQQSHASKLHQQDAGHTIQCRVQDTSERDCEKAEVQNVETLLRAYLMLCVGSFTFTLLMLGQMVCPHLEEVIHALPSECGHPHRVHVVIKLLKHQ